MLPVVLLACEPAAPPLSAAPDDGVSSIDGPMPVSAAAPSLITEQFRSRRWLRWRPGPDAPFVHLERTPPEISDPDRSGLDWWFFPEASLALVGSEGASGVVLTEVRLGKEVRGRILARDLAPEEVLFALDDPSRFIVLVGEEAWLGVAGGELEGPFAIPEPSWGRGHWPRAYFSAGDRLLSQTVQLSRVREVRSGELLELEGLSHRQSWASGLILLETEDGGWEVRDVARFARGPSMSLSPLPSVFQVPRPDHIVPRHYDEGLLLTIVTDGALSHTWLPEGRPERPVALADIGPIQLLGTLGPEYFLVYTVDGLGRFDLRTGAFTPIPGVELAERRVLGVVSGHQGLLVSGDSPARQWWRVDGAAARAQRVWREGFISLESFDPASERVVQVERFSFPTLVLRPLLYWIRDSEGRPLEVGRGKPRFVAGGFAEDRLRSLHRLQRVGPGGKVQATRWFETETDRPYRFTRTGPFLDVTRPTLDDLEQRPTEEVWTRFQLEDLRPTHTERLEGLISFFEDALLTLSSTPSTGRTELWLRPLAPGAQPERIAADADVRSFARSEDGTFLFRDEAGQHLIPRSESERRLYVPGFRAGNTVWDAARARVLIEHPGGVSAFEPDSGTHIDVFDQPEDTWILSVDPFGRRVYFSRGEQTFFSSLDAPELGPQLYPSRAAPRTPDPAGNGSAPRRASAPGVSVVSYGPRLTLIDERGTQDVALEGASVVGFAADDRTLVLTSAEGLWRVGADGSASLLFRAEGRTLDASWTRGYRFLIVQATARPEEGSEIWVLEPLGGAEPRRLEGMHRLHRLTPCFAFLHTLEHGDPVALERHALCSEEPPLRYSETILSIREVLPPASKSGDP